jgi:5,6-dimethylbenzimidazole synthase
MTEKHRYSEAERAVVYRVIRERRDMRHFRPDPVDPMVLRRLFQAASIAPSVGYMQPWRFLRITSSALRQVIHQQVMVEQEATAEACGERIEQVRSLKLEGILECGELLVAVLAEGRQRYVLGRRTLPEMDLCSVACAIQNLWLAARAEGLGMGWVSLFEPENLTRSLDLPEDALPIAVLCLGYVDDFYPEPLLETVNWDTRRPLEEIVFENAWNQPAMLPSPSDKNP